MRLLTRLLMLVGGFCALAITALVGASSASAALPEFLDIVAGNVFIVLSAETELIDLSTGLAIKCKKDKGNGEIKDAKLLKASIDFEKCSVGGLAAQSLGDKGGTILLVNLDGHLCYINKADEDVGILFTLPAGGVHIEVPSLGELLAVKGSVVGLIQPINVLLEPPNPFTLEFEDPNDKCETATGNEDVLLLELEHNGTPLATALVGEEQIKFAADFEIMA